MTNAAIKINSVPERAADLLDDLVKKAGKAGADAADAMLIDATALSIGWRMGKLESLERAESGDIGLRVFVGRRQAAVSTTDRRTATLDELVARAVAMARAAPEDPFCGLAPEDKITTTWPQLEMGDDGVLNTERMIEQAAAGEEAALAIKGVTNSDGAQTSAGIHEIALAASTGFRGHYRRTSYGLSVSVIAGEGTAMQTDYDYASRVYAADMPSAVAIGTSAGERAVKRLNPRKMPTAQMPVVFDPRMAGSLLGQLAGAISGASVARGTSFLKDKLGQKIFAEGVTIIDDPFRARGLRTKPFDAEGFLPQKRNIVEGGTLTTWLLDLRSARQLNLVSTGHASRSPGGMPHPSASNFFMQAGHLAPSDLIRDIKHGFYVTEVMGHGANGVTGDYSQAAAGFWIENGEIAFPVSEMTIAGNLKDMYLNLTPADDLEFLRGIDAPTVRVEGMTVAGL